MNILNPAYQHLTNTGIEVMKQLAVVLSMLLLGGASQSVVAQGNLSKFDRIKAEVQQICPVSGNKLGSMGDPLKVKIGEEQILLCCQECTKGKVNKDLWIQIHRNFAAAQGICPVMEKPLPANPKSTTVNGQTVYICCPPCTKKIQAEPREYLTKVAGYYLSAIKSRKKTVSSKTVSPAETISQTLAKLNEEDQLRAAVQQICPVSGNQLGLMGIPKKVRVGQIDVFLCCEGCKEGKVSKEHWARIAQNIKSAQGKCPVMEKRLPSNAKSTIVNGQLIFVCCPPCIKKIAASPEEHLAKINLYYQQATSPQDRRTTDLQPNTVR